MKGSRRHGFGSRAGTPAGHAYLDRLPVDQLAAVLNLLESMLPPLDRKLALASVDGEPITDAEREAVAEAEAWLLRRG